MFSTIIINIEQALSWFVDKFDGPLWDLNYYITWCSAFY